MVNMRWTKWLIAFLFPFTLLVSGNSLSAKMSGDDMKLELAVFAKSLTSKYGFKYLNSGIGTVVDNLDVSFAIGMMGKQQMTIDQARPMVLNMINEFFQKVSTTPLFDEYGKRVKKTLYYYDDRMIPEKLGLKIAFWDQNVNRYPQPYLSQIKVMEGVIYYYYVNPKDQSLGELITETYEEAHSKLKLSDNV